MIKLAVCVSWMQLAAMTATCDKYITNVVMVWLIMRHSDLRDSLKRRDGHSTKTAYLLLCFQIRQWR